MKKLRKSFGHAANGLKETLIHEINFKIMLGTAFAIVGTMFYLPTSAPRKPFWPRLFLPSLLWRWSNIVIERLLNFLHPAHHEEVRVIKDLMAAIVLISSFGAAIIGLMIFWPHIFNHLQIIIYNHL